MIEGWIPSSKVKRIRNDLKTICADEVIVKDWPAKDTPTQLANPKGPILAIFEKLTLGFGVPKSEEIDPTVLWLVTYPLFFGLMFGDVGNGIVVTIASSIIYFYKRRGLKIPDNAVRRTRRRLQHGNPRFTLADSKRPRLSSCRIPVRNNIRKCRMV